MAPAPVERIADAMDPQWYAEFRDHCDVTIQSLEAQMRGPGDEDGSITRKAFVFAWLRQQPDLNRDQFAGRFERVLANLWHQQILGQVVNAELMARIRDLRVDFSVALASIPLRYFEIYGW